MYISIENLVSFVLFIVLLVGSVFEVIRTQRKKKSDYLFAEISKSAQKAFRVATQGLGKDPRFSIIHAALVVLLKRDSSWIVTEFKRKWKNSSFSEDRKIRHFGTDIAYSYLDSSEMHTFWMASFCELETIADELNIDRFTGNLVQHECPYKVQQRILDRLAQPVE